MPTRTLFLFPSASTLERLHLYNIIALPDKYGINHVTDIMHTQQLASYYNLFTPTLRLITKIILLGVSSVLTHYISTIASSDMGRVPLCVATDKHKHWSHKSTKCGTEATQPHSQAPAVANSLGFRRLHEC